MNNSTIYKNARDNWTTPEDLFIDLNNEFHFTLDPCSDIYNHKCEKFYTIADNGLDQSWAGEIVFCNPPYGRNISKWVKKAYYEYILNNTFSVLLIPASTDTSYFHDYIYGVAEIRFIRGRLRFGGSSQNAPFPSMIVIYGGLNL